jgi:glycosyltransferase involved in cell wall biosynthesis
VSASKVCILNSYGITPNYGGPIGVFREAFLKVSGANWEIRSFSEVASGVANLRKVWHRLAGPSLKTYARTASLHRQFAHDAAYIEAIPGLRHYPAVWFSDLLQYLACRPSLAPSQKAILQLHNPALPSLEAEEQPWLNADDRALIQRGQRWALANADLVVLANRGAEEIYGELLAGRPVAHLQNAMAGDGAGEAPILSRDHTNFLFVGRRNRLKGFDLLMDGFARAHDRNPSLRLYLLGDGAPETAPGVVDLQFSRTPDKWIAAASCVVIPNRSSYLDLNLLQALSLDTPVMLTCTEGHGGMRDAGPGLFDIGAATAEAVSEAMLAAPKWLAGLKGARPSNRDIFERDYALPGFAARLDDICRRFLREGAQGFARSPG